MVTGPVLDIFRQLFMKTCFCHFLKFGTSGGLDTVYYDSFKYFPALDNITRLWRIIQMSQICIFEWSKKPKKRFLAIFMTLVCWIDLILHSVIVLNVFHHSTTFPDHEGSFKCHKSAFLNDPNCQKGGFWSFSWVWSVGSSWHCILC